MDGILPLWKERGMTSHDCIYKLRKILKTKKIGHTGTLDPEVEGVLPICIGQATRIAQYLTDAGKTYEAVVALGRSTTTEDAQGETVEKHEGAMHFTRNEILQVLKNLTGEIEQTPPMFSAVKVKGKKLYEYARAGIEVERPTRQVTIYELELLSTEETFEGEEIQFSIRIKCSKGTYIRTLAVQIGEALGVPAHMHKLVRTMSGTFQQNDCFTLDQVAKKMEAQDVSFILPVEYALSEYPFIPIDREGPEIEKKINNGQQLPIHPLLKENEKIVFTKDGKAFAIYIEHPEKIGIMKLDKMFPNV